MTDEKVKRTFERLAGAIEKACEGYVFDEPTPEAVDRYNRECIRAMLDTEVFDLLIIDREKLEGLLESDALITEVDVSLRIIPKV